MQRRALLVDFGSTFTKVRVVDLASGHTLGSSQVPSTVETDITHGLRTALAMLEAAGVDVGTDDCLRLACSSAAGGLRIVAVGLVRELTAEAAERSALGAGAKVIATYAQGLTAADVEEIESLRPDLIVLSGGTDGGNRACLEGNAASLAETAVACPIVVAGNRNATERVTELLLEGGKAFVVTENVLPDLGRLNVDACRGAIREVFLERIVRAKGLAAAEALVGTIAMPTPHAVLLGVEVLAEGTPQARGLGELVCVDVGGATTDVYSIATGDPKEAGVVRKGLPEPVAKRTVEGDLGLRLNAERVAELAGEDELRTSIGAPASFDIGAAIRRLRSRPAHLPEDEAARKLDIALARWASTIALQRHAGTQAVIYGPTGATIVQSGKDLRSVPVLVGTGGIFASASVGERGEILSLDERGPTAGEYLTPEGPALLGDTDYVLFAAGLLTTVDRDAAFRVARRSVTRPDPKFSGRS